AGVLRSIYSFTAALPFGMRRASSSGPGGLGACRLRMRHSPPSGSNVSQAGTNGPDILMKNERGSLRWTPGLRRWLCQFPSDILPGPYLGPATLRMAEYSGSVHGDGRKPRPEGQPRGVVRRAWMSAPALASVSSNSFSGNESATMPAPAWSQAV